jgi:uncharacterized RDD family membrane protein YckC
MAREITVVTPENVQIEYELAGLASRTGAAVLDMLLQTGLWLVLVLMGLIFRVETWLPGGNWVSAILGIIAFIIYWGYFVFFETLWNGQTPGKRYARLRVVREGGVPIDLPCAAIRGLIRVIDFFLLLTGVICILVTQKNQRLGDLAAGTLVVKERVEWTGYLKPSSVPQPVTAAQTSYVRNIELITPDEFEAARRFVERRAELQANLREGIASRIAKPLMVKLGMVDTGQIPYSDLLCEVYNRCRQERGMR